MNVVDTFSKARDIVAGCERALKRKLTDGERRDLLKDNTNWPSGLIADFVDAMRRVQV